MPDAPEVKEGIFHFDPDDPIYRDHFPGYPVVPGSLVVQAFLDLAGDVRGDRPVPFPLLSRPGGLPVPDDPH